MPNKDGIPGDGSPPPPPPLPPPPQSDSAKPVTNIVSYTFASVYHWGWFNGSK